MISRKVKDFQRYDNARRYREEWEIEFPWVRKADCDNEFGEYAICTLCSILIAPRKARLRSHEYSKGHLRKCNILHSTMGEKEDYREMVSIKREDDDSSDTHFDWEREFPWLSHIIEDGELIPYCKLCSKPLPPKRASLVKHSRRKEHRDAENCASPISSNLYLDDLSENPGQPMIEWNQITVDENGMENIVKHVAKPKERSSLYAVKNQLATMLQKNHKILSDIHSEDKFSVYGRHVANELRDVTDPVLCKSLMHKINTLLYEAQMEQQCDERVPEEMIVEAGIIPKQELLVENGDANQMEKE